MRLTIEHTQTAAPSPDVPSPRVLELAAMFGLGVDESRRMTIVPRCEIPIPSGGASGGEGASGGGGGIVFITGPSGSGKSTILRLIAHQCCEQGRRLLDLNDLPPLADAPLVDVLGETLEQAVSLLSLAGLGDAFVMLRTPLQLSDGQRARLKIAHAMQWAESQAAINNVLMKTQSEEAEPPRCVLIADEFAATLDRLTAKTLARSVRRWISRTSHVFIIATTHDDLLEALQPEVLVYKGLGDIIEVCTR